MATEQGYYALAAYQRFRDGKTSLYDMSDLTTEAGEKGDGTGSGVIDPNKPSDPGNPSEGGSGQQGGSSETTPGKTPEKEPGTTDDNTPGTSSGQTYDINNGTSPGKAPGAAAGTSSGKTPGTTTGTSSDKTTGAATGKTAGKTAGKTVAKADSKDDSGAKEETKPWSFDGKTYVADVKTDEDTASLENSDTGAENAEDEAVTADPGGVFTGDRIPYVLVFVLGAGFGIGGYVIFSKRKKQKVDNN